MALKRIHTNASLWRAVVVIFLISGARSMVDAELSEAELAEDPAAFEFFLHDDLTETDVRHLQIALTTSRPAVLEALGLSDIPTVSVHVWQNEERYQEAMEETLGMRAPGSRGYVTGDREIRLLFHRRLSAQREAVHEFVHAVTLNLNPDFGNNPRWLWEAAAIYLAGEFVEPAESPVFANDSCPTLETLNSPFDRGGSIYSSGYILGEFIVAAWAPESLPALISANGNTSAALNTSEAEFEQRWCEFVQKKYLD